MLQREADRLESLEAYHLTEDDPVLQGLAALAASACGADTAFVSVVCADRLRFVASSGSLREGLPRAGSFCTWVVENHVPLVIPDVRTDERFRKHECVVGPPFIRSYAGTPLIGREGLPLGTLCVLSAVPRVFEEAELAALRTLAQSVVDHLEVQRLRPSPSTDGVPGALRTRRALDNGELVPWFQPIVEVSSGQVRELEALVRWQHPRRGVLLPADLPVSLRSNGLSRPIGRMVLHESLRVLADLRAVGAVSEDLRISVNLAPPQLEVPGLADAVLAELDAHRLPATCLAVEVTGWGLLQKQDVALAELTALSDVGVGVTADELASGRAALPALIELPVSTIKLPRRLVAALDRDPRARAVAFATLELARDLGVEVIAVGVERQEQLDHLVALGCRFVQGNLLGAPVPREELPAVLSMSEAPVRSRHGVHFSSSVAEHLRVVTGHVRPALDAGGGVLVVATADSRRALESELASQGVVAVMCPGYRSVDAHELLAQLLVDGRPRATAVRAALAPLLDDLLGRHGSVTASSEMVSILWERGEVAAAVELEDLWNGLLASRDVDLLCAYPTAALAQHGTAQQLRRVRDQHTSEGGALRPWLTAEVREHVSALLAAGASVHTIAGSLNAEGLCAPDGRRWHWRQVKDLLLTS